MKAYVLITIAKRETLQDIADKIRYIPSCQSIISIDHYGSGTIRSLPKIMVVMQVKDDQLDVSEERKLIADAVDTEIKPIPGIKSVKMEFALPVFLYR